MFLNSLVIVVIYTLVDVCHHVCGCQHIVCVSLSLSCCKVHMYVCKCVCVYVHVYVYVQR